MIKTQNITDGMRGGSNRPMAKKFNVATKAHKETQRLFGYNFKDFSWCPGVFVAIFYL